MVERAARGWGWTTLHCLSPALNTD